ncbi:MAG TPA: signal peptidase I [Candidatus Paceibacterota bacterium]|nr:signal peptidase I [Verrucomicrobiota bacterium]HRY47910.1 signal peptidase I [Candidatus Paceibacterota bacterium]HRZ99424.1 signal peptidase I [Candidatus Paceibacterota bacterium]
MNTGETSSSPSWWIRLLVGRHPKRTLLRVGLIALTAFVVFRFILLPIRIQGISMLPTYREGGVNFANRWAYRWREPQRGDVISIAMTGHSVMLLKRIIGMPGDRVAIRDGRIFIDDKPLDEPYVKRPRAAWNLAETLVPPDAFFVVGDNREMPLSLHEYGTVERSRIVGKVLF